MQYSLATSWQLEAIGDTVMPRVEVDFPNTFVNVLPETVTAQQLEQCEWYLSRDFTVDEALLTRFSSVELVLGGIDYPVEVRLNGMALFDYPVGVPEVRKEIYQALHLGNNRLEILFVEPDDEDVWFGDHEIDSQREPQQKVPVTDECEPNQYKSLYLKGMWLAPYLNCSHQLHLNQISVEQIWHHGLGCEVKIQVQFSATEIGMQLHTAHIRFGAMSYCLPVDVRSGTVSAIFHLDAPRQVAAHNTSIEDATYPFAVDLDGQHFEAFVTLVKDAERRVFRLGES
ncbi:MULTISPECIES: hypothetical protein [unclassified Vibrio]|uniref:Beta-galactosidase n=1 Tax=Vibrio sp. HB236076 TaxID=3232307 RepID=A0AB39HGV4_9VIBR|nr:hypothetical protein [Vibrio sp. HB161653]MDP5255488.1 hypothetical protein [Vibrio sp. HB161653]